MKTDRQKTARKFDRMLLIVAMSVLMACVGLGTGVVLGAYIDDWSQNQ